jgi:hypothetical protein
MTAANAPLRGVTIVVTHDERFNLSNSIMATPTTIPADCPQNKTTLKTISHQAGKRSKPVLQRREDFANPGDHPFGMNEMMIR